MKVEITALIIEDECTLVFLLKQVLKIKGINSFKAGSIKDARILLNELQPTFIFVDNELPDGLGFDMIPLMRQKCPDAQIIAMTAYIPFLDKETAFNLGADRFLEKPFSIEQVYNALKKETIRLNTT